MPLSSPGVTVEDTTFEPNRGFYPGPTSVVIRTDTAGAYIQFTTDGSAPLPSGGQPSPVMVTVDRSFPIRALAYMPDNSLDPTDVDTHSYVIESNPMVWNGTTYTSAAAYPAGVLESLRSLPALFISMAPSDFATVRDNGSGSIGGSGGNEPWERPCSAELHYPGHPRFTGLQGFQINAGLRPHSWITTKRAFRLYFKRIYGAGKLDYPVFESAPWGSHGAAETFDKLVLRNHSNDGWEGRWGGSDDALYLRDQFARACQYDMDGLGSRSIWVHLFVNAAYYGLYSPAERPDDDFQATYLGGNGEDYLGFNHGGTINAGADETIKNAAWNPGNLSGAPPYRDYQQVMDVRQFSDYLIESWYNTTHSHDWPVNGSSPQNFYGGNRSNPPRPTRHFTWDFEAALVWDAVVHEKFRSTSGDKDKVFIKSWFALIDNDDFMTLFADRAYRHLFHDGALGRNACRDRLTAMSDYVKPALEAEKWQWTSAYDHWNERLASAFNRIDGNSAGLIASLRSENYYPLLDPAVFRNAGSDIQVTRLDVSPGYALQMVHSNVSGTIYYTTDTTDPRAPGGGISGGAINGGDDATINIAETTVVKARVLDGSTWSAVHEAVFLVGQDFGPLKITEIMYHPADSNMTQGVQILNIIGDAGSNDFDRARIEFASPPPPGLTGDDKLLIQGAAMPENNGLFTVDHIDGANVILRIPLMDEYGTSATADYVYDGDRYAFVELKNTGTNTLDLSGVTFSDGVSFTFADGTKLAPGAFAVLANQPWDFTNRYTGVDVDGEYLGGLNNRGERVELAFTSGKTYDILSMSTDTNGVSTVSFSSLPAGLTSADRVLITQSSNVVNNGSEEILQVNGNDILVGKVFSDELDGAKGVLFHTITSVDYNDKSPWPLPPDGLGYSLVPTSPNPSGEQNDALLWRASAQVHGSPGADDPEPSGRPPLLINEALTHTDWPQVDAIEVYNPTTEPVDLAGWWLTDDFDAPQKFTIPSTNIPAGGYVVFLEDNDSNPSNTPPAEYFGDAFRLSSLGEEVYLFSPDVGYGHGFTFGAAENGVSFGRHVTSQAREHFPAQISNTLGAVNSGPRVGPVVITEVHYHPVEGGDEFVELQNISGSTVELFNSTNTWKLNGVSFTFPAGISMVPGEILLLVREPIAPAAFASLYGVPGGVQIFNYNGNLDNGGETLTLQKPDQPEATELPYIDLDKVTYDDAAPWPPGPDGFGPSLERINPLAYGNDPVNWKASEISPGRVEPPTEPLIAAQPAGFLVTSEEESSPPGELFEVWNAGISNLIYSLSDNAAWLDVNPLSGSSSNAADRTLHSISFSTGGLGVGVHSATISVTSATAGNSPVEIGVTVNITEKDRIPPVVQSLSTEGKTRIHLLFNEPVEAGGGTSGAENAGNYHIDHGVVILSASLDVDGRTVTILTSDLAPNTTYTLTIENLADTSGNAMTVPMLLFFEVPDLLVPEGLVAYWPMDEGAGLAAIDATGNGHDATRFGASWSTTGKFDNAIEFDGLDDYADSGGWSVAGTGLTVSAWIKPDDFGVGDARILSKATDQAVQDHWWMLSTDVSGSVKLRARLKTNGNTDTLVASSGTLAPGIWTHAALVYDGATMKIFKDAVEVGSLAKTGALDVNNSVLVWIGSNPGTPKPFDGLIDDVRVYDRALTGEEVEILHEGVPQPPQSTLVISNFVVSVAGEFQLAFPSDIGRAYVLQQSTNLLAGGWADIATNFGNGGLLWLNYTNAVPVCTYRILRREP